MQIRLCPECKMYHPFGFVFCPKTDSGNKAFKDYDKAAEHFSASEKVPARRVAEKIVEKPVEKAVQNKKPESQSDIQWAQEFLDSQRAAVYRWRENNPERYRKSQREYMRKRRAKAKQILEGGRHG